MRILLAAFLTLFCVEAFGQATNRISLTVTVTNTAATTNTFTINTTTRTWTNAHSASTILTNLIGKNYSATNLWDNFGRFPIGAGITHRMTETNVVVFTAPFGAALSGSSAGNWATTILSTQPGPQTFTAYYPLENIVNPQLRTNQGSSFVYGMGIYSTNAFPTNAPALSNHVTKGAASGVQQIMSPVDILGSLRAYASIYATNGVWTNGTMLVPLLLNPTISNATIFGNTTITGSSLSMIGSGVNNFISLTATSTVAAVGSIAILSRENGIATAVDASDVLGIIVFTGYGTTEQKAGARIRAIPMETFTDSTAGSILLFETTPTGTTQPVGRIHIGSEGNVTITNVLSAGSITNATFTGTNRVSGSMAWTRYDLSTLANGNNISVPFGTNKFIRLSGTLTDAASICGIIGGATSGGQNGQEVNVLNDTGYTVTFAVNTVDPVPANRINAVGGLDVAIPDGSWIDLFYDSNSSRWRAVNSVSSVTNISLASASIATNTATLTIATNDIAMNTYYTNLSQRAWVCAVVGMTNVLATDKAHAALYLDQDANGTWEKTGIACRLQGLIALAGAEELSAFLQPGARYMITNLSTGTATSAIEANSSQVVRQ